MSVRLPVVVRAHACGGACACLWWCMFMLVLGHARGVGRRWCAGQHAALDPLARCRQKRFARCRRPGSELRALVSRLAEADAIAALAALAASPGYCAPTWLDDDTPALRVTSGRHPLIEARCSRDIAEI